MTIAERFDRYVVGRARLDALERQAKELKNELASDDAFLKEWFRARKPDGGRYRGVIYSKRKQVRLDVKKARLLLGAKVADAEVTIEAERLELDLEAKAVRDATALKPVRRAAERVSA